MRRMFEGGLKDEVQNGKRNLRELLVDWPVLDNKGVYIHPSDFLKIFYSLFQLHEELKC